MALPPPPIINYSFIPSITRNGYLELVGQLEILPGLKLYDVRITYFQNAGGVPRIIYISGLEGESAYFRIYYFNANTNFIQSSFITGVPNLENNIISNIIQPTVFPLYMTFDWMRRTNDGFQDAQTPDTCPGTVLFGYPAGAWSANINPYLDIFITQASGFNYFIWPGTSVIGLRPVSITFRYPYRVAPSNSDYAINITGNGFNISIPIKFNVFPLSITYTFSNSDLNGLVDNKILRISTSGRNFNNLFDCAFNFNSSEGQKRQVMFLVPYQIWDGLSVPVTPGYTRFWYPGTAAFGGRQPIIYAAYAKPLLGTITVTIAESDGTTIAKLDNPPIADPIGMYRLTNNGGGADLTFPSNLTNLQISTPYVTAPPPGFLYSITIIN